jgi:hypothetical protein
MLGESRCNSRRLTCSCFTDPKYVRTALLPLRKHHYYPSLNCYRRLRIHGRFGCCIARLPWFKVCYGLINKLTGYVFSLLLSFFVSYPAAAALRLRRHFDDYFESSSSSVPFDLTHALHAVRHHEVTTSSINIGSAQQSASSHATRIPIGRLFLCNLVYRPLQISQQHNPQMLHYLATCT